MALKPRKSDARKLAGLLEQEYESQEKAAEAILAKAYEIYEAHAKYVLVGQVRPGTGWKSPEEGRDCKVAFGPFGTRRQTEGAGESLAYSTRTGEEATWHVLEYHPGTPSSWYAQRKERWDLEQNFTQRPVARRLADIQAWHDSHPGEPLPEWLQGMGWEGLDKYLEIVGGSDELD